MTKRYIENMAILGKMETVYGESSAPTGLANAMQLNNVAYEPLLGEDLDRELVLPYMGHQGIILDGNYVQMTAELEIAGSGTPGTPPAGSPLLRSCGLQEIILAATHVKYKPISRLFESATFFFNDDGVNHVMLGTRGTLTMSLTPRNIPRFSLTLTALFGEVSDIALPTVDLTDFITPVPVNDANTTVTLHGRTDACEGLTIDLGNSIEPRMLINSESIEQTGRRTTGNAIFEAVKISEKDWIQTMRSHAVGALHAQHGTVAGNIVEIDAPAAQIGRIKYGATNKIRNNTLPLMLKPVAGNDELVITFR